MVHLIRSLLTNLNNMIAIEAKYVELCNYTVAYIGLNFLQKSSAVAEGPRATHPTYVSPGDAWFEGSTVLYYGLVFVELMRLEGGGVAPFAHKFRMERVSPYQPFWRGQSAS